jgi:uncharacterized protein (TIGR02118 family)
MCHIFADSIDLFQNAFGPHAKEIMGDIKNYTDVAPSCRSAKSSRNEAAFSVIAIERLQ